MIGGGKNVFFSVCVHVHFCSSSCTFHNWCVLKKFSADSYLERGRSQKFVFSFTAEGQFPLYFVLFMLSSVILAVACNFKYCTKRGDGANTCCTGFDSKVPLSSKERYFWGQTFSSALIQKRGFAGLWEPQGFKEQGDGISKSVQVQMSTRSQFYGTMSFLTNVIVHPNIMALCLINKYQCGP